MQIVQSILTKNPCYTAGRKIKVEGGMLHSTGCPQPNALVYIRNWNSPYYDNACVHAFIDGDTGIIYQTLPWDHRGWHAGGSANNTHFGVEICEPSTIRYTSGTSFTDLDPAKTKASIARTYAAAVELFAFLSKEYGLDPATDIIGHEEGARKGVASNHADPTHLWKHYGYSMDQFRKDVAAMINDGKVPATKPAEQPKVDPATVNTNYTAKVTADVLNIRSGPGTNYPVVGSIKKDEVYTIVGETDNWGKLKSGAGWVYLDYMKKTTVSAPKPEADAPVSSYTVKVTADVLNIRSGVGVNYPVVGSVKKGEVYTIVEVKDGWGKLKSGAGWICLSYTDACGYVETPKSEFPYVVKVDTAVLNIRSGAGTNNPVVGSVKKGELYTITAESNGFGRLKSGAGWISLDYVKRV